jgi:hypothetical protein
LKKGWIRQVVADEALATDAEEVYNLLGFEVLRLPLEKRRPKSPSLLRETPAHFEVLYIRPKKFTESEEELDLIGAHHS